MSEVDNVKLEEAQPSATVRANKVRRQAQLT